MPNLDLMDESSITVIGLSGACESKPRVKRIVEECTDTNYSPCGESASQHSAGIYSCDQLDEQNSNAPSFKQGYLSEQGDSSLDDANTELCDGEEFTDLLHQCLLKLSSDVVTQSNYPAINQQPDDETIEGVDGKFEEQFVEVEGDPKTDSNCPNEVKQTLSVSDEVKQHIGDKQVNSKHHHCVYCEKSFKTKSGLTQHTIYVHGDRVYNCNRCDFSSKYNQVVQFHISAVHLESKPHKCPQCAISFTRKDVLNRHVAQVHNHEKRFSCSICDYKSSQRGTLTRHQRTVHDRVDKFQCSECDHKSFRKSNLKQHYLIAHYNDKLFTCTECGTAFVRSTHLKAHVDAVHKGLKPYTCIECDTKFSQRTTLKQHVKAKHHKAK